MPALEIHLAGYNWEVKWKKKGRFLLQHVLNACAPNLSGAVYIRA